MTQRQVAEYLHCDQSLYSKYERGERALPLEFAIKLSVLYGVTLDYLGRPVRQSTKLTRPNDIGRVSSFFLFQKPICGRPAKPTSSSASVGM